MTAIEPKPWRRLVEKNPLAVAVVLSLVIHLVLFGTWRTGQQLGWWNHHAAWLVKLTQKLAHSKPRMAALFQPKPKPVESREIPLSFVEVDPETVTPEAPKDAKYYSSKNAKASNTDPDELKEVPKVDGKQEQVVRVMDNDKPKPFPLQPAPPQPKAEELQPKPKGDTPGDLALNKPKPPSDGLVDTSDGKEASAQKERPRTLAQARLAKGMIVGEKMRQVGGVDHRGKVAFDTKATPFGEYDAAFIAAVQQCWYNLLDENQITPRSGRVVLEFKLNSDGRITDMKMNGNEVGELLGILCQRAIELPSPYPRWPADMRRIIGSSTREIRFTFYYN